jgi:hypothetical protein
MSTELCDCGKLIDWNSYFQKWYCRNCGAFRTESEQKTIRHYLKLKETE